MARKGVALICRIERGLAVVLIVNAMGAASIHAQCIIEENQPIIGSDTGAGDQFGSSVAISGDLAVVGAPFDATERGSVYVFRLENGLWVQEQKLMAFDPDTFGHFGASVDLDGDTLIVGAPDNDFFVGRVFVEDAGEADVYRRVSPGNWVHEATLQASNAAEMRAFGQSVALEGDLAVVGADRAFPVEVSEGAAYVFRRKGDTWAEEAILVPSTGKPFDIFGERVALSGVTIAVLSAGDDNENGNAAGAVVVFQLVDGKWVEQAELIAPDGSELGASLTLDESVIAVFGCDERANDPCNRVHIFRRVQDQWANEQTLFPVDPTTFSEAFGIPLAIQGDMLLVGARRFQTFTFGLVHLFAFEAGSWTWRAVFPITGLPPSSGMFPAVHSVALDESLGLFGSATSDQNGTESGSAYVIDLSGFQFADLTCDHVINGEDLGELLLGWGACPLDQTCFTDLNADGLTDGADLGELLLSWSSVK